MELKRIYQPIKKDLAAVDRVINENLKDTRYKSILELNNYLLEGKGKRIRPALVIISSRATSRDKLSTINYQLTKIASAIELIHIASLVHDDIIDEATLRHHKPTINVRFGEDVAIAFGDYLYAVAFELIASCKNTDILSCISQATKALCEGELIQVCERDNLSLLKERYLLIVKNKTASLFAASCQSGAMLAYGRPLVQNALKEYGLNLGIAFQIIDDYLDLVSSEENLGKNAGLDFKMGELTLPVLNLLSESRDDKNRIMELLKNQEREGALQDLRQRFINSGAFQKTRKDAFLYIRKAKHCLHNLKNSSYKESLSSLVDYVSGKMGSELFFWLP